MEIKIKVQKGVYALRCYDKNGNEIFYSSTRIGLKHNGNEIIANVPDETITYELKDISSFIVIKHGKIESLIKTENKEKN